MSTLNNPDPTLIFSYCNLKIGSKDSEKLIHLLHRDNSCPLGDVNAKIDAVIVGDEYKEINRVYDVAINLDTGDHVTRVSDIQFCIPGNKSPLSDFVIRALKMYPDIIAKDGIIDNGVVYTFNLARFKCDLIFPKDAEGTKSTEDIPQSLQKAARLAFIEVTNRLPKQLKCKK